MAKRIVAFLSVLLLSVALLTACTSTVNERCMYCGSSPSREYKKSDGTPVYVCEDCSSRCMLCGREKATKHYESLLGIVFVCDDCYKTATR